MDAVGLTKDQGWQIGVRRTLQVAPETVWDALVTQPGLGLWLGRDDDLQFRPGSTFRTREGASGTIVSIKDGSLIRLRHQLPDEPPTTVQVRLNGSGAKAVLSFHQERLRDASHREQMRAHWEAVIESLQRLVRT